MSAAGRAAVAGSPIGHSKSPTLHAAAYAFLGAPIEYGRIEAGADDAVRLAGMLRSEDGWRGLSATMPLKQALVPLMDTLSERVERLGAMNTVVVVRDPDRGVRLHGENTDVDGIVRALADAGCRTVGTVAVIGAGGTARAATEAAKELGATRIDFVVRSGARAAECLGLAASLGIAAEAVEALEAGGRMAGYDAVISTLPPHAADAMLPDLRPAGIRPGTPLLDVAYDPWPSAIAVAWERAGGRVVSGLSMLVHQAVEQVKLFTGIADADWARVTNVMCDAVHLPRHGS